MSSYQSVGLLSGEGGGGGHGGESGTGGPPLTSLSSVASATLSLDEVRARAAHPKHKLVYTPFSSSASAGGRGSVAAPSRLTEASTPYGSGYGDDSYASIADRGDLLAGKLHGMGGGLAGAALASAKPSRRKISRYWRLQRGTCCFRFTLLLLSIVIVFAGYFAFDLPSITADSLRKQLNIDNTQLGLLFSVYALPNGIIPMLSGAFFSRVGKWTGVMIIAAVITLGVIIVGVGVMANTYWLMVLGRVLYGMGGESVYVGVDILVTKWFKGSEVGLAYGLIQAAGQAGSFSAFYLAPPLDAAFGGIKFVYAASMIVTGTALGALALGRILEITAYGVKEAKTAARGDAGDMSHSTGVSLSGTGALAAAVLDKQGAKKYGAHGHEDGHGHAHAAGGAHKETRPRRASSGAGGGGGGGGAKGEKLLTAAEASTAAAGESVSLVSGPDKTPVVIAEEDDEIYVERYDDFDAPDEDAAAELAALSPCPNIWLLNFIWNLLGFSHLRRLKWDFWCVLGSIACYSSAFYTFLAFGNVWLIDVYGYDDSKSGQTVGIVSIFSMFVSPIIGIVMDKRGGQRYVSFAAMTGALFWFAIMGFTPCPPVVSVLFAGLCYSILPSALYPLLVHTVPDESFTAVYALVNSCINLFLTACYYFAGAITNVDTGDNVAAIDPDAGGRSLTTISRSLLTNEDAAVAADFRPVFIMFCCLTGAGTLFTGALARQQWLGHVPYVQLSSHH